MAHFTTEIRSIVEVNSSEGSIDERIAEATPKIFNFPFPIWKEEDRQPLEELILQHYYMREIGFETVGQWKLQLRTKLREIMPYYVDLWKTTQKQYNYLQDVDIWETYESERSGDFNNTHDANGSSETSDNSTFSTHDDNEQHGTNSSVTSDLPQVVIGGSHDLDYATSQVAGTNGSKTNNVGGGENSGSSNGSTTQHSKDSNRHSDNESSKRHKSGLQGGRTYTELINQYRDSLLQIPLMIINDLSDLFMGLW